jgi:hypothetical protein
MKFVLIATALVFFTSRLFAQDPDTAPVPKGCDQFNIDTKASQPLTAVSLPPHGTCHTTTTSGGELLPDPKCTPGAINPTLTDSVLKNVAFRTGCVRNNATSENEKKSTYKWYQTKRPRNNVGLTQTCELDHLVPLYLGGADTLDNIWPQCGPKGVALDDRYFKEKDKVEYFLGQQVREGKLDLATAQKGIVKDWTKFISDAEDFCASAKCEFHGQ